MSSQWHYFLSLSLPLRLTHSHSQTTVFTHTHLEVPFSDGLIHFVVWIDAQNYIKQCLLVKTFAILSHMIFRDVNTQTRHREIAGKDALVEAQACSVMLKASDMPAKVDYP